MSFKRACAALENGARVMATNSKDAPGGVFWSIDGQTIHPSAVKKLKPGLQPAPDGLWGVDTAQTYTRPGLRE